jgi:hypothetical protein
MPVAGRIAWPTRLIRRLLRIHISAIFDYGNVLCFSPLAAEIQGMADILVECM